MNRSMVVGRLAAAIVLCGSLTALAAFTPPSEARLSAAANSPETEMAGLLSEASNEQAANVVKAVIAKVLTLGLSSDNQAARIAAVVTGAFAAIPAQARLAFAASLGWAVAGSEVIVAANGAVSRIQAAVATFGGPQSGTALAQAFGTSYEATLVARVDKDPGQGDNEPPPVSTVYPGQNR